MCRTRTATIVDDRDIVIRVRGRDVTFHLTHANSKPLGGSHSARCDQRGVWNAITTSRGASINSSSDAMPPPHNFAPSARDAR